MDMAATEDFALPQPDNVVTLALPMIVTSKAVIYALASALLFGISTPAAKLLLGTVHPAILAGLLYCGAGVGIAIYRQVIALTAKAPGKFPSRGSSCLGSLERFVPEGSPDLYS